MNELLAIALIIVTALLLRIIVQAALERFAIRPEAREELSQGIRDVLLKLRNRN